mmetsp:Transcript_13365/g.18264  ORF Transcript_13365/g.18264 Transcript_13365/m.18264 type:complete len:224 (-) Transcript_13365:455-1126(-)
MTSTVDLQCATRSPGFSCKTGYGCNSSWFRHSTSPSLVRPESSMRRMVKGIVGNRLLISENTKREAFILRWYSLSSARLYTVVSFSFITLGLPSPVEKQTSSEYTSFSWKTASSALHSGVGLERMSLLPSMTKRLSWWESTPSTTLTSYARATFSSTAGTSDAFIPGFTIRCTASIAWLHADITSAALPVIGLSSDCTTTVCATTPMNPSMWHPKSIFAMSPS